jgi:hypothetical protein
VPEQPSYLIGLVKEVPISKKQQGSLCRLIDEIVDQAIAIKDALVHDLEALDLSPFFENGL